MTLSDLDERKPVPHKLSREEHDAVRDYNRKRALINTKESDAPTAVLLAGQPGAGKSVLTGRARQRFHEDGGAVIVDVDALRERHPDYSRFQAESGRTAASRVQSDAGRWGDELIQDASDARRNIIVDGTLKSPDKAEQLCEDLKSKGYRVEVHAIAVRKEDSELGVYRRYEHGLETKQPRWVPEDIRKDSYSGMAQSVERLNRSKAVDHIEVHGRSLDDRDQTRVLYAGPPGKGDPAAALKAERDRPRIKAEQTVYNETRLEVLEKIEARDPELREPENQKFKEICKDLDTARKDGAKVHAKRPEAQQASSSEPAPEKLSAVDRRRQAKAGRGGTAEKTGRRDKGLRKSRSARSCGTTVR